GQESIREALAYLDGRGPSLLDGGAHRVRALGLDADDAAGGPYLFDPRGGAADEPASADRNDNVFDLAPVLEDLLSDGPLPRDDVGVVEGRDHGESAFGCDRFRPLLSLDGGRAFEDDLGAECGCAFSLDGRGRGRHNDGGGDSELPRGECDGLGVVPGGVRDDAPPPVVVGESGDEVVRAADLECPGALEILALETDLRPDLLREPRRRQERCPDGDRLDGPGRIFDGPGLNETAHASPASSLKV